MEWLAAFTDDQIALIGCVVALGSAFAVMSLTWTVRQSIQPSQQAASAFEPRVLPKPAAADAQTTRKAA
jgi:hypothetical protein